MFAVQASGRTIETVEGLAKSPDALHPIQQAFWDQHALQCGFCTPGILMATKALLADNPDPTEEDVRDELAANLCRCTGYGQIVEAVLAAGLAMRERV